MTGLSLTRPVVRILIALAAVLLGALQFLDPGVGPLEKPMSSYALGAYANLWLVAVLCCGVAMLLVAQRWNSLHIWATRMLRVTGVSFIVLGLFITDPWYPWQHALGVRGWIHVLATGVGMGGLGITMIIKIAAGWGSDPTRLARWTFVAALAYIVIVTLVGLATLLLVILGRNVPLIGLEERVLVVLAFLWLWLGSSELR